MTEKKKIIEMTTFKRSKMQYSIHLDKAGEKTQQENLHVNYFKLRQFVYIQII